MDIAAVAIGANLVEKTITLDRTTRSVEHLMSLEPSEMQSFVRTIRDVETALGGPRRMLTALELEKRKNIRRSVVLRNEVSIGQSLSEADVYFSRPGHGLGPDEYELMGDYRFVEGQSEGTVVHPFMLKP
jgi:sialic acid synthase SpsE